MLQLKSFDPRKKQIETLVVLVCEDSNASDPSVIREITNIALKHMDFKGKSGDQLILFNLIEIKADCVIFLGIGPAEKVTAEKLRHAAGKAASIAIKKKRNSLLFSIPGGDAFRVDRVQVMTALLEGACLANYLFDEYKSEKKENRLARIELLVRPNETKNQASLVERIQIICTGTHEARKWVSMPSNDKRPEQFARLLTDRARKEKLSVSVLTEKKLADTGFGALLAVSAGSPNQPRLVIMDYHPENAKKTVALVGKGVTFDSGGINLKPSGSLEDMKMDMAGAAAVAATLFAVAKLKPNLRVIGAMPLVENMPSGDATRPGDIIKTYAGKTVEIINTDAEGRLILIDTMAYIVKKYKPAIMIDLATLTGACVVALGEKIAGMFSPNDTLAAMITAAGEATYERCWRLPLPEDYTELLKSDFADFKNVAGSRWGGAIVAALFLAEFVGDTLWAHIDIAGPAYAKKANAYCRTGGTGFGVRLLCDLLERVEKEEHL